MNLELAIRILDPETIYEALKEIQVGHELNGDETVYRAIRKARKLACQTMRRELDQQVEPVWTHRKHMVHYSYENGAGEYKEETFADWCCPNCEAIVGEQHIKTRHSQRLSNYCHNCGLKIDWDAVAGNLEGEGHGIKQDKD